RESGIPVPEEVLISDSSQMHLVTDRFKYPVVVKPQSSFTLNRLTRRNYVQKAHSDTELLEVIEVLAATSPVTIQENIIGKGVGVELLAHEGDVLLAFQHERVHEPLHGGGSSYRKSVALDAHLLNAAAALMRALKYTGVAMVEFKVD